MNELIVVKNLDPVKLFSDGGMDDITEGLTEFLSKSFDNVERL